MDRLIRFSEAALAAGQPLPEALPEESAHAGAIARSVRVRGGAVYFIFRKDTDKRLAVYGGGAALAPFEGTQYAARGGYALKSCPRNIGNSRSLQNVFAHLNPSSRKGHPITLGLGDRLGLAGNGHLRALEGTGVFPVLAQQSIRELTLTGRTYEDVLSAAVWAAFEEGYDGGFGADGDHLKNAYEIEYAIGCGYSMITLDCSEHIDNAMGTADEGAVNSRYAGLPREKREEYEDRYLGRIFALNGGSVVFSPIELKRSVLVYGRAVDFACGIYERFIAPRGLDFEISVDETLVPTSPANHFFVASELYLRGARVETLAPRFCGEFQKGIDYIGDTGRFRREYAAHEAVARHFGYRLSIHSGSDKFAVFPIIGELSGNGFHLKTAGTSWLEALRALAAAEPGLIRRIYAFAVENLDAAKAYYHIAAVKQAAPDISGWPDGDIPKLLDADVTRQILHIAYGLALSEKRWGEFTFKSDLYAALARNGEQYAQALARHFGRHLDSLGIRRAGL